jgi:nitrate reductase gamma subunit
MFKPGEPSRVHELVIRNDEASCHHCHAQGNPVGAASMVLPAKSIICMPCHAGTFSVGDSTTILTLIVFIAGLALVFSYVLSGASSFSNVLGGALRTVFSKQIGGVFKTLFLDVFLQRRLYRQSPKRWLIHGLIFYAFAFRFIWGIIALLGSLWKPEWTCVWPMLDKNSPLTAFLFDLSGVMILLGVLFAYLRGRQQHSSQIPDLPRQDVVALGLIAAIVVVGFILESMRIAMTGFPDGSCYAFLGSWIARLVFGGASLTVAYGWMWYVHALLTGAFIAYVPFSNLLHIIISPFVLMGSAISRHERR